MLLIAKPQALLWGVGLKEVASVAMLRKRYCIS